MRKIRYETRDGDGNDIVKDIEIKEFKVRPCASLAVCPVCGRDMDEGVYIKDAVSSNFTDWVYFGDSPVVCTDCAALFSVYPYSYIYTPEDGQIKLLNIRQIEDAINRLVMDYKDKPFIFVISTSQKKHLFYKAKLNQVDENFSCGSEIAINLEEETIYTTTNRQSYLFKFIESLQILGTSKSSAARGEIAFATAQKLKKAGIDILDVYDILQRELGRREIQIALHASQMPVKPKHIAEPHEMTAFYMLKYAIQTKGEIPKL